MLHGRDHIIVSPAYRFIVGQSDGDTADIGFMLYVRGKNFENDGETDLPRAGNGVFGGFCDHPCRHRYSGVTEARRRLDFIEFRPWDRPANGCRPGHDFCIVTIADGGGGAHHSRWIVKHRDIQGLECCRNFRLGHRRNKYR